MFSGIITLTTDFGLKDHYVALLKARLLGAEPRPVIVDVSHQIAPLNLSQAAYVVGSAYKEFPENTLHILGINAATAPGVSIVFAQIDNQYFIARDNGLLRLISSSQPTLIRKIGVDNEVFSELNVMVAGALAFMASSTPNSLGEAQEALAEAILPEPKYAAQMILGKVIYVDQYGNAITNIRKDKFEEIQAGRNYQIKVGRFPVNQIVSSYNEVESGSIAVVFNQQGLLEVAIFEGNAEKLLALTFDRPVIISFQG